MMSSTRQWRIIFVIKRDTVNRQNIGN